MDTTLDAQDFDQRYAMDNKLYVVFYMRAVKNGGRSDAEGRPIFDDVPHVRIHVPGDKTTVIDVPATDEYKHRFAVQWDKFQRGMEQAPEGTPVEEWPQLTVGQVQEFKAMNIYTVEQLAGMSDAAAQKFMGGNELKRKADTFLKVSKDTAEAQRLATENAELKQTLAGQQVQIADLASKLELFMQKADAPSAATLKGQQNERTRAGSASGA